MGAQNRPVAPPYVQRKIKRLKAEIAAIDEYFYHSDEGGDPWLYASMLERKRDDVIRSAVLQLHTGIEDILTSWIVCRFFGIHPTERKGHERTVSGRALMKLLNGPGSMGFNMKLDLAVALKLFTVKTRDQLAELNTLRNRCSHHWILGTLIRRQRAPHQKKMPLLRFRGKNLHDVAVFQDMAAEYGVLYARLFVRYLDG